MRMYGTSHVAAHARKRLQRKFAGSPDDGVGQRPPGHREQPVSGTGNDGKQKRGMHQTMMMIEAIPAASSKSYLRVRSMDESSKYVGQEKESCQRAQPDQ